MKILLAVDGSKYGEAAAKELARRPWPAGTQVRVLSVAHGALLIADPVLALAASHVETLKEDERRAAHDVARIAGEIAKQAPALNVSTEVLEGSPKKQIVEAAERWGADLIVLGSRGHGPTQRFLLGSVAQAVAQHAPCSVEIVRLRSGSD